MASRAKKSTKSKTPSRTKRRATPMRKIDRGRASAPARKANPPAPPSDLKLEILFDATTPQPMFENSRVAILRDRRLTERELLEEASRIAGPKIADFARQAILSAARSTIATSAQVQNIAAADGGEKQSLTGRRYVRDSQLQEAYESMIAENLQRPPDKQRRITPSSLRNVAGVDYTVAKRWCIRNHPELLAAARPRRVT